MNKRIINEEEYLHLLQCEKKLKALENYGVDAWEGYEPAMESIEDDE